MKSLTLTLLSICVSIAALLLCTAPAAAAARNVHTTFSGDPTNEVTVSWRTSASGGTSVQYGLTPALGSTASGSAFLSSGRYQHHVALTGLEAGQTYYYQPEGGSLCTFKTAQAGTHHFRFAAVGDVQGGNTVSQRWTDASNFLAQQENLLFWMPLGDLVQDGGTQVQYDAFWAGCSVLSESVTCMPIIGNHDRYGEVGEWPQNYLDQFRLPSNGTPDYQGHWYDFEVGDMHFSVLHSNPKGGPLPLEDAKDIEVAWLDEVMSQTDKNWKFAAIHPPTFSTGGHGGENLNSSYRPTWEAHDADAVFTGHVHSFETTYPIRDGELADSWDEGTFYYNSAGVNYNAAVPGDWFSSCWQTEDYMPLVGIVDVFADEIIVTTYNYEDGSIYHQVTITPEPASMLMIGLGALAVVRRRR